MCVGVWVWGGGAEGWDACLCVCACLHACVYMCVCTRAVTYYNVSSYMPLCACIDCCCHALPCLLLLVSFSTTCRYAPRKPKYFNRIHTGYEWNKYNQTHYDTENPPPKVVQGYKFNIFYPDLLDRSKAPTYRYAL